MHNDFLSISDVISKEAGFAKLRRTIKQHDVIAGFYKIFPDLKKIASVVKIEKKVLHLKVNNSVWRSELKFNQQIMIDKINLFYEEEIIKTIKFQA